MAYFADFDKLVFFANMRKEVWPLLSTLCPDLTTFPPENLIYKSSSSLPAVLTLQHYAIAVFLRNDHLQMWLN